MQHVSTFDLFVCLACAMETRIVLDWLIFYFFSIWMPIFVFVIHMALEKSLSAVSLVICGCI